MLQANARWELGTLLKHRQELKKQGLELGYSEDKRVDSLREFLDAQQPLKGEEVQVVKPEVESDEEEMPF